MAAGFEQPVPIVQQTAVVLVFADFVVAVVAVYPFKQRSLTHCTLYSPAHTPPQPFDKLCK